MHRADIGVLIALVGEARALGVVAPAPGRVSIGPGGLATLVTGIGPDRAREGAGRLAALGVRALCNFGVAGGLHPGARAGDLVVPDAVVDEAGSPLSADAGWTERLRRATAPEWGAGTTVLSVSRALVSPEDKACGHRGTGAVAVDMESFATAAVAHAHGLAYVSIRAVSDPADTTIPADAVARVDAYGRAALASLVGTLLVRPSNLPRLFRVGRQFRAANRRLARAARAAGSALAWE